MAKKLDLSRNFSTSSSDVGESSHSETQDPPPPNPVPLTRRLSDLAKRFGIV